MEKAATALNEQKALSGRERAPRIVMVNDERGILEMFKTVIQSWLKDVTVLMFDNGVDALEELSRTDPDLLITDDRMARRDGLELCQRLLDKSVTYPIIMTSSYSPTGQWSREFARGGLNVSLLTLPCTLTELLRHVGTSFKTETQAGPT